MSVKLNIDLDDGKAREKIEKLTSEWVKTKQQIIEIENEVKNLTSQLDELAKKYENVAKALGTDPQSFANSFEIVNVNKQLQKTLLILDYLNERAIELGQQLLLALNPPETSLALKQPSNIIPVETITESANETAEKFVETTARVIETTPIPVKKLNIGNIFNSLKNNILSIGNILNSGFNKISQGISINILDIFKNTFSRIGNMANNVMQSISGVGSRILKLASYTFVFSVITKGFKVIRSAAIDYINTNNELQSSLAQVRGNLITAFQPIWEFILPYLIKFTQWLSTATAYISAFISALFGKTEQASRNNARALQNQIALSKASSKSLKKQKKNTDDLTKANNKNYNSLAQFDELTVLSKEKEKQSKQPKVSTPEVAGVGTPSNISFDTPKIDTAGISQMAEKIKSYFLPLQEPFNKLMASLDRLKGYTLEAFGDFYNIFLKPLSDYTINKFLPTFLNNLADCLDRMDFSKVNEGLRNLWVALEPLMEDIGDGINWLFEKVLFPLSEWTVNDLLPQFLQTLANILNIIEPIAKTAGEQINKLYEKALKPLGEWTGGKIIQALTKLNTVLKKVSDWAKDEKNKTAVEWISATLLGLATTVITIKLIPAMIALIAKTWAWTAALLANPITWVIALISLLVGALIMLITHFDDVKAACENAWNAFKDGVYSAWEAFKQTPFGNAIANMIENIKNLFKGLVNFITGVFAGDWNKAWKGLLNAGIAIINTFLNAIDLAISSTSNFIAEKINGVIDTINSVGSAIGLPSIGKLQTKKSHIGRIPYLATGAVIPPNSPFLAMLGDQKSGVNIETPLETMKQAFKEALAENGNISNGSYTFIAQLDGRTLFEETVNQNDMYRMQTGRSAFVY